MNALINALSRTHRFEFGRCNFPHSLSNYHSVSGRLSRIQQRKTIPASKINDSSKSRSNPRQSLREIILFELEINII